MAKDRHNYDPEELAEIEAAQDRICDKVHRIMSIALLDKLEDFVSRIYRRGDRR